MMNQDNSLQEVSYEMNVPSPSSLEKAVSNTSLPVSKLRGIKYAIKTINHIKSKGTIDVTFKIPAAINEGLKTGKYLRKGGVIVQKDGKQVVHWLREGKKLTKLGNALFQVTDIFSEIALNEKLKQILVQLDEIVDYVKARHNALIPAANEALRHAFLSQDENERRRFLLEAEEKFKTAKLEIEQLIKTRVNKNHTELIKFEHARISNTGRAKTISDNLNKLMALTKGMAYCAQAQISINEYLKNTEVAIDLRANLADSLSAMGEYVECFIEQGNDYDKLLLLKMYSDFGKNIPMNLKGGLDSRLKRLSIKDLKWFPINYGSIPNLYPIVKMKQLCRMFNKAQSGGPANLKKNDEGIIRKNVDRSLYDSIKIELVSHTDDLLIASGLEPENEQ